MSSPQHKYYNAFNLIPQIGPKRLRRIRDFFPTLEDAWKAKLSHFLQAGIEEKVAEKIVEGRHGIDPDREFSRLEEEVIHILTEEEEGFPRLLREIPSAPIMLYVKGEIRASDPCLGVVGSRKLSPYGQRAAEDFARGLSRQGLVLASGMAYGADTIIHRECLKEGRRTVAVLGSGLDEKSIYPSSNRALAREIAGCGCLVSEYPPGTPPLRQNFPARNRLISGLSRGILVIEAGLTSGSLITARFALEQNREVFAVPGSIYAPGAEGTNNLIKMGAKPACKLSDILEEFNLKPQAAPTPQLVPETPEEELVLQHLSPTEPLHIDKLSIATGLRTAPLASILTLMEMKGMVQDVGGMRYIKR
jgi:DNA processing protein